MESPTDPAPGPPGPAAPDRLPRAARIGLSVAAALALGWILLHAAVDRPAVRDRVRTRALEVLRSRLGPVELAEPVEIDWALRAWMGPLRVPAVTPGAEPLLQVGRIRIRASLLAALSGRLEPASIRLLDVRFAPGEHGRELDAALERWRARKAPGGPPGPARRSRDPVLHLRRLTVAMPWHGRTVPVGPFDARLERRADDDGERIDAFAWLTGGGHLEARLRRSPGAERGWTFQAAGELEVSDLPAATWSAGLNAEGGTLSLELQGTSSPAGLRATLRGALDRLWIRGDRVGPEPIGPLAGHGEAELTWSTAARRLELHRGRLEALGPLRLEAEGEADFGVDPSFALSVVVPPVDYQALVAALPEALAPPPGAPRPPGSLKGSLQLSGPLTPLVGWTVMAALDLGAMRAAAATAPPSPLLSSFVVRPDGAGGKAVRLGPDNPDWVPLSQLPEHVVRAVTTAEDAGFFGHQGFDFAELLDALAAGAQAGRVVRGGSTISQQLAKNLYLSRERTVARKAQEALVTVALEASLPKQRLLELYLNLIEWAPGVHGIGAAARHYFAVDARQLTPIQACFLAAIIPGPNRSHRLVAAGLGDKAFRSRVDDLLLRLNRFGVLSDEALGAALAEPLRFAFGAPTAEARTADPEGIQDGDDRSLEAAPAAEPEARDLPSPGGSR